MPKFRRKPVVIEAVKFDGSWKNAQEILRWMGGGVHDASASAPYWAANKLYIPTLEGEMTASSGDWIIRSVKGEFYPCKPDIFNAIYDAV